MLVPEPRQHQRGASGDEFLEAHAVVDVAYVDGAVFADGEVVTSLEPDGER